MSFIRAEDDASVICEDTSRSIRDYLKNTHRSLSGIISQEDGNYSGNNSERNVRMVSCDEVQEYIFINNNNNIRYKLEDPKFFCIDIVDILFSGETKLDSYFPYSRVLLMATINHFD